VERSAVKAAGLGVEQQLRAPEVLQPLGQQLVVAEPRGLEVRDLLVHFSSDS